MKGRKRHGGRKANRGTPRETPSCHSRRAVRAERKIERLENRWGKLGLYVSHTSRPGAVVVHVPSPMGPSSPILARYAREIEHARARGFTVTAERIEAEMAEYQERGQ